MGGVKVKAGLGSRPAGQITTPLSWSWVLLGTLQLPPCCCSRAAACSTPRPHPTRPMQLLWLLSLWILRDFLEATGEGVTQGEGWRELPDVPWVLEGVSEAKG